MGFLETFSGKPKPAPALNKPDKDFKDFKIDDVKGLFPDMETGSLLGNMIESGNPGVRLIENEENLLSMLKILYFDDNETSDCYADALAECSEFLLNPDGSFNPEVLQRVEWIKIRAAARCSVKGRFADAYKQTATGVLTNAMSDRGGWSLLNLPLSRNNHEPQQNGGANQKRP